jgi:hypothetical protein
MTGGADSFGSDVVIECAAECGEVHVPVDAAKLLDDMKALFGNPVGAERLSCAG